MGLFNGLHWVGGNGCKSQSVAPRGCRCLVRVVCSIKGALVGHSLWCQVNGFSSVIGHGGVCYTGEFLSGGETVGHGSEWFGFQRGRAPYSNAESPIEVVLLATKLMAAGQLR